MESSVQVTTDVVVAPLKVVVKYTKNLCGRIVVGCIRQFFPTVFGIYLVAIAAAHNGLGNTRPDHPKVDLDHARGRLNMNLRMGSSSNVRSSGYRGREDRSIGNQPFEERPRFADDRSIAEVARDEQQERQRFFQQQQQQGRRDLHDADLSRYGAGRGGGRSGGRGRGRGRGRGDRYHVPQAYRGGRSGTMYHHDLSPPEGRSPSPMPPSIRHRSVSPPPRARPRSSSPAPPSQQQRELYGRGRHGEFAPRGRESRYSPPPSPLLPAVWIMGLTVISTVTTRATIEVGTTKGHRSHRERREKRLSRPERSMTPSPVRQEHTSGSSGRKSGHSPHRSFNRRPEGDNQAEEASGNDKHTRSKNEDVLQLQEKEVKNGGARLARDELFAGMDDLAVDYEEDDE
ncbi:unnamed protein product [Peronospora destructor]|uniref:Uncharacterized protein n=1 Tax=Peronospora destructor TaxID=86335 RepID=A0AAV0TM95_9STRA|nr:unnamed protein product [Peronospora destructor]